MKQKEVRIQGTFHIKELLAVTVTLNRIESDGMLSPLMELNPVNLSPGNTLMFEYPEKGIEVILS